METLQYICDVKDNSILDLLVKFDNCFFCTHKLQDNFTCKIYLVEEGPKLFTVIMCNNCGRPVYTEYFELEEDKDKASKYLEIIKQSLIKQLKDLPSLYKYLKDKKENKND